MSEVKAQQHGSSPLNVWKYDVEKILAVRKAKVRGGENECLVKFKNVCHRKLKWKKESAVRADYTGAYYLSRSKKVFKSNIDTKDFINPEWTQIARIVSVRTEDWYCSDESDVETLTEHSANAARKKRRNLSKDEGDDFCGDGPAPSVNRKRYKRLVNDEPEPDPAPAHVELVTVLICDGCDAERELGDEGLTVAPEGDWFCPSCELSRWSRGPGRVKPVAVHWSLFLSLLAELVRCLRQQSVVIHRTLSDLLWLN